MLGSVRVYLCRHAKAAPGEPDELRELTGKGRKQARALGEQLAGVPEPPVLVLTSPLTRARQTAEAIAEATGAPLRVEPRLAPGATARDVRAAVARDRRFRRDGRPPAGLLGDRVRRHGCRSGLRAGVDGGARARPVSDGAAIRVRGLRKSYDGNEAVRGIDFDVLPGEVFGLLGPNGAGKTTTVEILEGYRPRDGGDVRVLGVDPWGSDSGHRERIGVVLQQSELPPALSVREVHCMFAGYFRRPRDVDEVIELVGLADKAGARVKTLSGGQKRRLDLGIALVGDPELVFLDEPTTGFDPSARRTAWDLVRSLRSLGKTIVLTTHYLDEAQQLSDRVAVIREGSIVRIGTPDELIGALPEVEIRYREADREVVITTTEPTRVLADLTGSAAADGRELEALEVRRPTLEDVYLDLVDGDQP